FLSQQSRQYFSSPRGSETSLAPHSAHRDLTTDLRGISWQSSTMERPSHGGLRHLALNVQRLDEMKRFYVDVLGFAVEWEPDADNIYLSSGIDNLALHRSTSLAARRSAEASRSDSAGSANLEASGALDHLGLIVRSADD